MQTNKTSNNQFSSSLEKLQVIASNEQKKTKHQQSNYKGLLDPVQTFE